MAEKKPLVENYRFLDPEERKEHEGYFRNLTEKIRFIGDVDLLRTAREDISEIEAITSRQGDFEEFSAAANGLLNIIGSGPGHPLLTKVVATMKYCDLIIEEEEIEEGISQAFMDSFNNAVRTEPEQHGSVVLSGALYARLLYHTLGSDDDGGESIKALRQKIAGVADSKEKEINMLGVITAASALSEMFGQDALKPRLPVVTIVKSRTEGQYEQTDATYPDKTMCLGIGRLASEEKMKEAAIWGMPDNSRLILTRRLPRALVGIEVNKPLEAQRMKSDHIVSIKNLVHTNIAPVRVWDEKAERIFDKQLHWRDENVLQRNSFDSLSYWLAVRVSRDLIKKPPNADQVAKAAANRINGWISHLEEPLAHFQSGEEISILGEALREYNKRNPDKKVTEEELKTHLYRSAIALTLKTQKDKVLIRDEESVAELYKEHIWRTQLKNEDKTELAIAYLEDRDTRYCHFTDEVARNIRLFATGRAKLAPESSAALVDYADNFVRRGLVLRFETIRNKTEPGTLKPSIFEADEAEE